MFNKQPCDERERARVLLSEEFYSRLTAHAAVQLVDARVVGRLVEGGGHRLQVELVLNLGGAALEQIGAALERVIGQASALVVDLWCV